MKASKLVTSWVFTVLLLVKSLALETDKKQHISYRKIMYDTREAAKSQDNKGMIEWKKPQHRLQRALDPKATVPSAFKQVKDSPKRPVVISPFIVFIKNTHQT